MTIKTDNVMIPHPVKDLVRDLLDKKSSVYSRSQHRTRIAAIAKLANQAITEYDREYTAKHSGRK